MIPVKRMRVFAGPNGSGKTTIINNLRSEIPFGVYVNADDIESLLKESGVLLFNSYQLLISQEEIRLFFQASTFSPVKRNEPDLHTKLFVNDNVLHCHTTIDSYVAADLAEFIRQQLVKKGLSFTYETVLSHPDKLNFLQQVKNQGYRVYLYFVATEDPDINVSRVQLRVAQHGHNVAPNVIKERYFKSLRQLRKAVEFSNRAYIWDNSGSVCVLIAEITEGEHVSVIDTERVSQWFVQYLSNEQSHD
jgi:predicted ABC-type ATPase